ncbi:putative histone deacetylase [Lyophyllum shimeji]|uniref:Histone deacetylase n=1 Tax=Lyophyllum shimeji TaxID=47721 RepID=A0A9P3PTR6_LYOSH|nr:putative histone deacetylase [Lyophyllum shimeji]
MPPPLPTPPSRRSAAVFLQAACYQHQYIRSRDSSGHVERPERLRAVTVGLSAAIARLESAFPQAVDAEPDSSLSGPQHAETPSHPDPDDLAAAMDRMNIAAGTSPVSIVQSQATADLLSNPAVKYVHGDVYVDKLKRWTQESADKIRDGRSEIPPGLPQGDLYLCPESINAIQGAIGTVCEAVDRVVTSSRHASKEEPPADPPVHRAFVAIRPPGHHCGEDSPSGFCFVNNVAIGVAHAHLKHGINRVVILDIDLHHGNGTQALVWHINEETHRQKLTAEAGAPPERTGLRVYYGSLHDILSYPCEDGKPERVQAASVSLHNAHGQYIENVHLQTYTSESHFRELYANEYSRILRRAEQFLDATGGAGDDVLVFISCGMDACEHEYASMSRHDRKVPVGFYHRFTRDARALADRYAAGRIVSVLEGGYSDRALISGAMAHLSGLVDDTTSSQVDEEWWSVDNLVRLENLTTKKRRGGRASLNKSPNASSSPSPAPSEPWLTRTLEIFQDLEVPWKQLSSPRAAPQPSPMTMTLRERKAQGKTPSPAPPEPAKPNVEKAGPEGERVHSPTPSVSTGGSTSASTSGESVVERVADGLKKIPRVILRLGPEPSGS